MHLISASPLIQAAPTVCASRRKSWPGENGTKTFDPLKAKLARGYPSDFLIRKQEEFDQYNRNEIADPAALRRVGALRQAVARLRHSSAG
jgi:hypothetical protein